MMKLAIYMTLIFTTLACNTEFLSAEEEVEVSQDSLKIDRPEKITDYAIDENPLIAFDSLTPIIHEELRGPVPLHQNPDGQSSIKVHATNIKIQSSIETSDDWVLVGIPIDETFEFRDINKSNVWQEIWKNGEHFATTYYVKNKEGKNIEPYIWYDDHFIRGYVHNTNIALNTVPEHHLENLINAGDLSKTAFDKYLWSFQFQYSGKKLGDYDNIQQFYKHPSYIDGRSAPDRLLLIFQNEKLIAVQHDRSLNLDHFQSFDCEMGLSLIILADWTEEEKKAFTNTISDCKY